MRKPQTNGFVERANRTDLDEFFRTAFLAKFYKSAGQLQAELDEWLAYYNTERPHYGYRDMCRRPIDTINLFLEERGSEAEFDLVTVRHDA